MTPDAWAARQAALRQFIYDCPTRYVLEATSEAKARHWFDDDADVESIDCGPMFFGTPRLVAVQPIGASVGAPESTLSRWCARLHAATRFTMPKPWTLVDVPVVALEDLLP